MKKLLILVVSVVMLTGWRSYNESSKGERTGLGSPKTVAEDFALAIIQKEPGRALEFFDTISGSYSPFADSKFGVLSKKEKHDLKLHLEDLGKKINDEKLECEAILEDIMVPPEFYGYHLVNGKKYTGESARVILQFVKRGDKKSDGLEVSLVKVDGSWKVKDFKLKSDFETSSEDSDREDKPYRVRDRPSASADGDRDSERDRVREYERLCRQYVSLLRRKGQDIPEEAIEEEVEKFKKYSRSRQEEELEKAEEQLMKLRKSADKPKAESRKYEYEEKKPGYPTTTQVPAGA